MTLRTRAGSETSNQMSRNKNLKKLRQRYKSTMIISLDAEGLDRLVVNEQFRLVLVSDAAKPKPELMSVQDINVIDFNLNESAVNAILLHRVVSIENAPLAEQLDKWLLKRARTALSLRAIEQQLLEFLSASEGALIAEAGEMSKLNVLRKRQDKVRDLSTFFHCRIPSQNFRPRLPTTCISNR